MSNFNLVKTNKPQLVLAVLFISLGVILSYANSYQGLFILDDEATIVKNPSIRKLWPPWKALQTPSMATSVSRPIANLSFAFSYALNELSGKQGTDAWGFHIINTTIHLLNSLVLFAILLILLKSKRLKHLFPFGSLFPAAGAALLFAVHPLQTESVTYISQRVEALMALFFLLTIYCSLKAWNNPSRKYWSLLAFSACLLGMGSKEVMVSAPLVVLLIDFVFYSDSLTQAWQKSKKLYLSFALTWGFLAYLLFSGKIVAASKIGQYWTHKQYLLSQSEVILYYLKLFLWPANLCLDYKWSAAVTFAQVWQSGLIIIFLLSLSIFALYKRSPWGLTGVCFFLILAPTSTIPLMDPAVEHRMYLPCAFLISSLVFSILSAVNLLFKAETKGKMLFHLSGILLISVIALTLGRATYLRNRDYQNPFTIWLDTVKKRPLNPRAHNNLARALLKCNDPDSAFKHYRRAIELDPNYSEAHYNLGALWQKNGNLNAAIKQYNLVLKLKPNAALAHNNLGIIFFRQGNSKKAVYHYQEAIKYNPDLPQAHFNLGSLLLNQGKAEVAATSLQKAATLSKNNAMVTFSLAVALELSGKKEAAISCYKKVLQLAPKNNKAAKRLAALLQ